MHILNASFWQALCRHIQARAGLCLLRSLTNCTINKSTATSSYLYNGRNSSESQQKEVLTTRPGSSHGNLPNKWTNLYFLLVMINLPSNMDMHCTPLPWLLGNERGKKPFRCQCSYSAVWNGYTIHSTALSHRPFYTIYFFIFCLPLVLALES